MDLRKRVLALLMSLTIVLTFMPAIAFADENVPADGSETIAGQESAGESEEVVTETEVLSASSVSNAKGGDGSINDGGVEVDAYRTEDGFAYTAVNSDGGNSVKIVGYNGVKTVVDVPEKIDGRPVSGFSINPDNPIEGDDSYDNITQINFPDSMLYLKSKNLRKFPSLESFGDFESAGYFASNDVLYKKYDDGDVGVAVYPAARTSTEWVVDENVNRSIIYSDSMSAVTSLTLSPNIEDQDTWELACFEELQKINVPDSSKKYVSIDDVLYGKEEDGLFLASCPVNYENTTFKMPDGITRIDAFAFGYGCKLKKLILSPDIESIDEWALEYCADLEEVAFAGKKVPSDPRAFSEIRRVYYDQGVTNITYPEDVEGFAEFVAKVLQVGLGPVPEDCDELVLGEEKVGNATSADQVITYRFTTPEDGPDWYKIELTRPEVQDGDIELQAVVFAADSVMTDIEMSTNADSGSDDCRLSLGCTYYIQYLPGIAGAFTVKISADPDYNPDNEGSFADKPDECDAIQLNEEVAVTVDADETSTFSFTPEKGGEYQFESISDVDTKARVLDKDEAELASDDDSGNDGNFLVEFTGNAGETYYLQSRLYHSDPGQYSVIVRDVHELAKVDEVPATCTAEGTAAYWECEICGKKFADEAATEEITAPTPIAKKKHTLTEHAKVDATTEKPGTEAYWECEVCHKLFSDKDGTKEITAPIQIVTNNNVANAEISGLAPKTYTGQAYAQNPVVKLGGVTLEKDKDYKVAYANIINAGTARVTITGCGIYKGTKVATFAINPKAINPIVTLNATEFSYSGTVITPAVTQVRDGNTPINAAYYTAAPVGARKEIGTYGVTVTMKGNYRGSATVYFTIGPKGTNASKPKGAKKALTVKWKAQKAKMLKKKRVNGYQIQVSPVSNFASGVKTKNVKGYKKKSVKVKGLAPKAVYYVRVRTYMSVGGKTYFSPWSAVKFGKTK